MTDDPTRGIDPRDPAWREGYRDGYLARPAARAGDPVYMDGRDVGEAETGAPREYIDPVLWAERHAAVVIATDENGAAPASAGRRP